MMELLKAAGVMLLTLLLIALFVLLMARWDCFKAIYSVARKNGNGRVKSIFWSLLGALVVGTGPQITKGDSDAQ